MAFHTATDHFALKNYEGESLIQAWFQKKKNILSMARAFSEYNRRFFTLDLKDMKFYYTNKTYYGLKDMTFIDFKEITNVKRNSNPINYPKGNPYSLIIYTKTKDYYLYTDYPQYIDNFLRGFSCIYNKKTLKALADTPLQEANTQQPIVEAKKQENYEEQKQEEKKENNEESLKNSSDLKKKTNPKNTSMENSPKANHSSKKEIDYEDTPKKETKIIKEQSLSKTKTIEISIGDEKKKWSINLEVQNDQENQVSGEKKEEENRSLSKTPSDKGKNLKNKQISEEGTTNKVTKNLSETKEIIIKDIEKEKETMSSNKNTKEQEEIFEKEENFDNLNNSNTFSIYSVPRVYKIRENSYSNYSSTKKMSQSGMNFHPFDINDSNDKSKVAKKSTNIWEDEDEEKEIPKFSKEQKKKNSQKQEDKSQKNRIDYEDAVPNNRFNNNFKAPLAEEEYENKNNKNNKNDFDKFSPKNKELISNEKNQHEEDKTIIQKPNTQSQQPQKINYDDWDD